MNISSFQSAEGAISRVITARLKPGTEFLTGIIAICEKHHIQQGYISCCIGSLQKATFCAAKKDNSVKIGAKYANPIEIPGPVQFVSGQGFICQSESGEYILHIHGTFSNWKNERMTQVFDGHMWHEGNPVLITMELIINEVTGLKMLRKYDDEVELVSYFPEQDQENKKECKV